MSGMRYASNKILQCVLQSLLSTLLVIGHKEEFSKVLFPMQAIYIVSVILGSVSPKYWVHNAKLSLALPAINFGKSIDTCCVILQSFLVDILTLANTTLTHFVYWVTEYVFCREKSQCFTFTLTDIDGNYRFGFCYFPKDNNCTKCYCFFRSV